MILITDVAVGRAIRALIVSDPVDFDAVERFEQAYNCRIEKVVNSSAIPKVIFNTEQDEILFILRFS